MKFTKKLKLSKINKKYLLNLKMSINQQNFDKNTKEKRIAYLSNSLDQLKFQNNYFVDQIYLTGKAIHELAMTQEDSNLHQTDNGAYNQLFKQCQELFKNMLQVGSFLN